MPVKSVQEVPLDLWAVVGEPTLRRASLNPVTQPYTLTGDVNIVRASFVVRLSGFGPGRLRLELQTTAMPCATPFSIEAACRVLSSMSVEDALTVGKNYIGLEALRIAQEKI